MIHNFKLNSEDLGAMLNELYDNGSMESQRLFEEIITGLSDKEREALIPFVNFDIEGNMYES
jgi:hypothetical protein